MEPVEGARTFAATGQAYDGFMGRYSHPLAVQFASFAQAARGQRALDVGCGPGALTRELSCRLGVHAVAACDPSASFVAECADRNPGVVVRRGSAEHLPFDNDDFDLTLSQLVLHFVSDTEAAAAEMKRVLRTGGTVAACVWDFSEGMEMLRAFWDAALTLDPEAPDEQRVMRFGRAGEIAQWLTEAHVDDVTESTLTVTAGYQDFDELWSGFLAGIGPSGSYCVGLPTNRREALRAALHDRLGAPTGPLTLRAVARAGKGTLL